MGRLPRVKPPLAEVFSSIGSQKQNKETKKQKKETQNRITDVHQLLRIEIKKKENRG